MEIGWLRYKGGTVPFENGTQRCGIKLCNIHWYFCRLMVNQWTLGFWGVTRAHVEQLILDIPQTISLDLVDHEVQQVPENVEQPVEQHHPIPQENVDS